MHLKMQIRGTYGMLSVKSKMSTFIYNNLIYYVHANHHMPCQAPEFFDYLGNQLNSNLQGHSLNSD